MGGGQIDGGVSVEAVAEAMTSIIDSRHRASEVLMKVAEDGSWGGFPDDVTCEQIGAALERIAGNSPEDDPMLAVITGWRNAERERRTRHI